VAVSVAVPDEPFTHAPTMNVFGVTVVMFGVTHATAPAVFVAVTAATSRAFAAKETPVAEKTLMIAESAGAAEKLTVSTVDEASPAGAGADATATAWVETTVTPDWSTVHVSPPPVTDDRVSPLNAQLTARKIRDPAAAAAEVVIVGFWPPPAVFRVPSAASNAIAIKSYVIELTWTSCTTYVLAFAPEFFICTFTVPANVVSKFTAAAALDGMKIGLTVDAHTANVGSVNANPFTNIGVVVPTAPLDSTVKSRNTLAAVLELASATAAEVAMIVPPASVTAPVCIRSSIVMFPAVAPVVIFKNMRTCHFFPTCQ